MLRSARWIVAALLLVPAAAQNPPAPRTELPGDWGARDVEGKWVAYHRAIGGAKDTKAVKTAWMWALGAQRELELREWIVIFDRSQEALVELARAEAPQLVRAAMWMLTGTDSRGCEAARKLLLARGPRVRAWLDANATVDGP